VSNLGDSRVIVKRIVNAGRGETELVAGNVLGVEVEVGKSKVRSLSKRI
jgi:hypothetical protein